MLPRLEGVGTSAGIPNGAEANATGLEMSSNIFSSIPQKRENGSSVSGIAPRLRNDSSEEEEELRGDRENWSPGVWADVRVGEAVGGVVVAVGCEGCEGCREKLAGRRENGGTPIRVAKISLLALHSLVRPLTYPGWP